MMNFQIFIKLACQSQGDNLGIVVKDTYMKQSQIKKEW